MKWTSIITIASLSNVLAAQSRLIDPRTRFNNLTLSFPRPSYPVLQTDFETPPDCGEDSYVGSNRLAGRRALITGGDSGIGRATVIAYMREGATVAINYLPAEEPDAQDLADFLRNEFPNRPLIRIPGNLLNETFCTHLVHEAERRMGGLDIVVNNAGYGGIMSGPNYHNISQHSTKQFDRVFRTNVYASFYITRAAVPLLPPGSAILFTVSALAFAPISSGLDYQASKAALVGFIRGLSLQVGFSGIRVGGVAPGLTYTPFPPSNGDTIEEAQGGVESQPFGRMAQPVEISPLFVNLADDRYSYTSGSVFGAHGARPGAL